MSKIKKEFSNYFINKPEFTYFISAILSILPLLFLYLFSKFEYLNNGTGRSTLRILLIILLLFYCKLNWYLHKSKLKRQILKILVPTIFGIISYGLLIIAFLTGDKNVFINCMLGYLLSIYVVVIVYTVEFMFPLQFEKTCDFYTLLSKPSSRRQLEKLNKIIFNDGQLRTFIQYKDGVEAKTNGKVIIKNLRKLRSKHLNAFNKLKIQIEDGTQIIERIQGNMNLLFSFLGVISIRNLIAPYQIFKGIFNIKLNIKTVASFTGALIKRYPDIAFVLSLLVLALFVSEIYKVVVKDRRQCDFCKEMQLLINRAEGKIRRN